MKEIKGIVEKNIEIAPQYYLLEIKGDFPPSVPGQFAMLSPSSSFDPFLRRPFGIADQGEGWAKFIYKVVGRGTTILSTLKPGDNVSLISPLGKGFDPIKENSLLIAGGTGIAPILYLAKKLSKFVLLYGAKTEKEILKKLVEEFVIGKGEVIFVTEDGSLGKKGLLTQHIPSGEFEMAYVAGPYQMMKKFSRLYKGKALFSMETRMGCGFGVCYSCVVKVRKNGKEKYVRSCVEGPVFKGEEIIWI